MQIHIAAVIFHRVCGQNIHTQHAYIYIIYIHTYIHIYNIKNKNIYVFTHAHENAGLTLQITPVDVYEKLPVNERNLIREILPTLLWSSLRRVFAGQKKKEAFTF